MQRLSIAKAAYALMGADRTTDDAKYVLKRFKQTEMSKRDLYRECRGRFKKPEDIDPALELLEQHKYIIAKQTPQEQAGRKPSPVYLLNPLYQKDKH